MNWLISKSKIKGSVDIPSSKSITIRAILAASLASGKSTIYNYLKSDDSEAIIDILTDAGISIKRVGRDLEIIGNTFTKTDKAFNARSSATTLRFLIPVLLVKFKEFKITANNDLLKRPMEPYLEFFETNNIDYKIEDGVYHIKGDITPGQYEIDGTYSSQFVSGLLYALSIYDEPSVLIINNQLASKPYLLMTLNVLEEFGNHYIEYVGNMLRLSEGVKYKNKRYQVENDYSQAAIYLALGVLGFDVKLKGLSKNSIQGDREAIKFIEAFGGKIKQSAEETYGVKSSLEGTEIDLYYHPDLFLILAVLAIFSKGVTTFTNIDNLRHKESDRINSLITNLDILGIDYKLGDNKLEIHGDKPLNNKILDAYNDHRVIMALTVLAIANGGNYLIRNTKGIDKTYPNFKEDLERLGVNIFDSDLNKLREEILETDQKMIDAFKRRATLVQMVSSYKQVNELVTVDKKYEEEQIEKHLEYLDNSELEPFYKKFYKGMLKVSYDLQKETYKMALIGKGISHSYSPRIHEIISDMYEFDYEYDLIEVESVEDLDSILDKIRTKEYDGFNVTMPYKHEIIKYLDFLTVKAAKTNAVNLVYIKNGFLIGDNVDYDGVVYTLKEIKYSLRKAPIYILGAGATAKTVAKALDDLGYVDYVFVSRTPEEKVNYFPIIGYDTFNLLQEEVNIINTTPVGMYPEIDRMPISASAAKRAEIVFDVIYNPAETLLLKTAGKGVNGLDMLVVQALESARTVLPIDLNIVSRIVDKIKEELDE